MIDPKVSRLVERQFATMRVVNAAKAANRQDPASPDAARSVTGPSQAAADQPGTAAADLSTPDRPHTGT